MLNGLLEKLCFLPVILFSLSFHELSHGFMAYKMGDNTAKAYGRLTINPFAHIDIIGTLAMLLFGFGWAKPVPVNYANLKHKRLGPILIAAAGPLSNIFLAVVAVILYTVCMIFKVKLHGFVLEYFVYTILINITLAAFNLIPIPPLDGSKLVIPLLPGKWQFHIYKNEIYIQIVLFGLLYLGVLDPVINFMSDIVTKIVALVQVAVILIFA